MTDSNVALRDFTTYRESWWSVLARNRRVEESIRRFPFGAYVRPRPSLLDEHGDAILPEINTPWRRPGVLFYGRFYRDPWMGGWFRARVHPFDIEPLPAERQFEAYVDFMNARDGVERRWPASGLFPARRSIGGARRTELLARDGGRCVWCARYGIATTERLCLDHVIPICADGSNDDENLQVLCFDCNMWKKGCDWRRAFRV